MLGLNGYGHPTALFSGFAISNRHCIICNPYESTRFSFIISNTQI